MTRLTQLTLITVTLIPLAGCSGGWPRWMCRGDSCNTCNPYGEGTYSGPSLMAPSYVTPSAPLPGPITSGPST